MLLDHVFPLDAAKGPVVPGLEMAIELVLAVGDRPEALSLFVDGGLVTFPGGLEGEAGSRMTKVLRPRT
jgi:hypothetical protein